MASRLLWFRLPKGRVWHVACSGAEVALCGQGVPPVRGERQPKRPPFGARPCPDCESAAVEAQLTIVAARAKLTSPPAVHASGQRPPAFPACEACGHPFAEHDWAVSACIADEDCTCGEYQVECTCGHPWATHDIDSTECTEPRSDDDSGEQCPCPSFTAAVAW